MSTINLICTNCGVEFKKDINEYKRRLWKLPGNTNFFCSRSCTTIYNNKISPSGNKNPNPPPRPTHPNRKYPELVTYYVQRCSRDCRFKNMDISKRLEFANHLIELWEKQQHICAISKLPLTLRDKNGKCTETNRFKIASIDRINNELFYEIGNVQWVSFAINMAKNDTNNEEFIINLTEFVSNMAVL